MRIVLTSYWFSPSVGGVQTSSKIFAEEFAKAGHSVTVVTNTPGPASEGPYQVVRQPSYRTLLKLGNQSDLIFQNLISLRILVPLLLCRKPIVIKHASWLRLNDGSKRRGFRHSTKLPFLYLATNVATNRSIAGDLPVRCELIGNPFEIYEFEGLRARPRDRDIVFMGRLVSDKGCDLLLQAVGRLKSKGISPTVTVIGDGPEMPALKRLAEELCIADQITFTGILREGRGEVVARHRVMAIPSLWDEPFGVVALEGISAGCAIVASVGGGLVEAVGPCGLLFPNGDAEALAAALERVLSDSVLREQLLSKGPDHLRNFQPGIIARQYLDLFQRLITV